MNQRERNTARRELAHALDALSDGAGRDWWGPGAVATALHGRSPIAGLALDSAAMTGWDLLQLRSREQCLKCCRALAPAILEVLLGEQPDDET
jgi:hypothetical protein